MLKWPPFHRLLQSSPSPYPSLSFPGRSHHLYHNSDLYLTSSSPSLVELKQNVRNFDSAARHLSLQIEARKHAPRTESAKVRNLRSRKLLTGTSKRPRLLVFCSDKHLYVQIIDDANKRTMLSASTSQKNVIAENEQSDHPVVDAAKKIGEQVAKECFRQGITTVILYRKGTLHWRRVRAFQLAAQDQGLEIQFAE